MQALPSLQTELSATGPNTHAPVAGLQLSAVHALLSLQTLAVPVQLPPLQKSDTVHKAPSLHALPSLTATYTHKPLVVLQASPVQALPSSHLIAAPPHVPTLHASLWVHGFLSSHSAPSILSG